MVARKRQKNAWSTDTKERGKENLNMEGKRARVSGGKGEKAFLEIIGGGGGSVTKVPGGGWTQGSRYFLKVKARTKTVSQE